MLDLCNITSSYDFSAENIVSYVINENIVSYVINENIVSYVINLKSFNIQMFVL